jgi:hypothetical protein
VDPGPAGYLVGRVGLGEGEDGLKRLLTVGLSLAHPHDQSNDLILIIQALRRQIVLNNLLSRVLDPSMLQIESAANDYREGEADENEDEDFDMDILSQSEYRYPHLDPNNVPTGGTNSPSSDCTSDHIGHLK